MGMGENLEILYGNNNFKKRVGEKLEILGLGLGLLRERGDENEREMTVRGERM